MKPAKEAENAWPPMTTFQRIMKTPTSTSSEPTTALLMVGRGRRRIMNGTRLPRPYWRIKILKNPCRKLLCAGCPTILPRCSRGK